MIQAGSSTRINLKALNTLCTYWLEEAGARRDNYPDIPSAAALGLVGIDNYDLAIGGSGAFELGFDFAIRVARAVMSDPLGNPVPDIEKAAAEISAEVRHAKKDHVKTLAADPTIREAAANPKIDDD